MSHRQPAMEARVVATAPHARSDLISYTCRAEKGGAGRSVLTNRRELRQASVGCGRPGRDPFEQSAAGCCTSTSPK